MKILKDVKLMLDLKQKKNTKKTKKNTEFNFSQNETKILEKFLLPLASFTDTAYS